jgi:hypothetical protein
MKLYLKVLHGAKNISRAQVILILNLSDRYFCCFGCISSEVCYHLFQSLVTESFNRESLYYLYLFTPAVGIIIN